MTVRWGLRGRSITAVTVILVTLLVIATVVVWRAQRVLADLQRQQLEAVTAQWTESMRYAVLARSEPLLEPSLQVATATPEVCGIDVLDDAGGVIATRIGTGDAPCSLEIDRPVFTRADLPGDGAELAAFGLAGGERREVGRVVATFSTAAIDELQARMRTDILIAFLVLGALALVVVAAFATSMVRRVRSLAAGAERVAAGALDTRVEPAGADELTVLTERFNSMTESLESQRRALDDAATQLAEREALAAIGRATAVIAHELKNPLGILLGGAEVVANPARSEDARTKAAGIIREEVRRLERTLDELLAYARPRVPDRRAFDLRDLCRRTGERATLEGGPAVGLRVDVCGEAVMVEADEQHVTQIVFNLVVNAAQAGARTLELRVCDDGTVVASDDGPGIDPAVLEHLFRPFVTSKQRGAGLGLAASRRMARDNGGELRLVSNDAGAVFELRLPVGDPS